MAEDLKARWTSQTWRAEAETWIKQTLRANGLQQTAPIEQRRLRFWSTQLTVATDHGLFWFKANNPDQAFEATLVAELAQLAPDHVVIPMAIEPDSGWMLSPDQGPTMYAAHKSGRDMWVRMVQEFAHLQRQLIGHDEQMVATGLTKLAPTEVGALVETVLERAGARPNSDPRHADADLGRRVREILPWLAEHAALLESGPVPLSLEHNDLHHNNTFVPQVDQPLRFFDFGDAVWAHPFTSMCVPVEHMSSEWEVGPEDADIQYVVDSYLDVWSDFGASSELRMLIRSALPLGEAHRLLSWERVLPYADSDGLAELGGAIPGWLARLAERVDSLR